METKIKKGDLINVLAEGVSSDYEASGDISLVLVDSSEEMEDISDFYKLSRMQIFKIEKNDVHASLAKYGVNIGHFSLNAIKVKTTAVNDAETEVKINGEYIIPLTSRKSRPPVLEAYFSTEEEAHSICGALNKVELKKMKQLNEATEKALVTLDQIVKKNYV